MMKKLFALIMALAMCFVFTACGGEEAVVEVDIEDPSVLGDTEPVMETVEHNTDVKG